METDAIIQELKRRFAAPLPEFHQRRVIFWRDEDGEFRDKLFEIQLTVPVNFVQLNGHNNFEVKKLLCHDDLEHNYLVYDPLNYATQNDDWLLNLRLLGEEFRSDLVAIWMEEMHFENTPAIRQAVKENRKFFNAKERREKIVAMQKNLDDAGKIRRGILAVLCNISSLAPMDILRATLWHGMEADRNEVFQKIQEFDMESFFWELMALTGFRAENPNIHALFRYLVLTATAKTLPQEHLLGLEDFYSPHQQNQTVCYGILSDWLQTKENRNVFYAIIRGLEEELHLNQRMPAIPIDELLTTATLPCIDESILQQIFKGIQENSILPDDLKNILRKRRTMAWHDTVAEYSEGAWQAAEMLAFQHEHSGGFHIVNPKEVWQKYTEEYFRMDTFYRKFHLAFQQTLAHPNPVLDDAFKSTVETMEGIYSHWFLGEMGNCWLTACQDDLKDNGQITDLIQQENFYSKYIEPRNTKIYVLISDGLRYEVAAQATERLRLNTQSEVTLDSCQAIFPTSTKFGMAALLPHLRLSAVKGKNALNILADGEPTDSPFREQILQKKNPSSVALQFDKIKPMKRAERLELVRGKEVIYIYMDAIDKTGHNSPADVFSSCEKAVADMEEAVRMIVNDFCAHFIYITSDHGFLYTYHALQEDEKVDKAILPDQTVEVDSRYLIAGKDAAPEHLLPVRFLHGETDFTAFAPRENIRFKKQGGYTNYIHGGISLQEMVVPVIYYHFVRNSSKDYREHPEKYDTLPVSLQLLSASRKITNMMFALSFYQKEPVGANREEATYVLYFINADGQRISDEQKILANSTEENEQKRTYRCQFNLKSLEYHRTETYYLVIAEESGIRPPQKEAFQIDMVFAMESFGFFNE